LKFSLDKYGSFTVDSSEREWENSKSLSHVFVALILCTIHVWINDSVYLFIIGENDESLYLREFFVRKKIVS
jgi:hypothetical protein